ncbi:hypothetical protein P9Y72_29935 [Bacillus cereus]|nr:hypothetical protein [Bacillus thuringiensis]MEC2867060.1 hypothetical protein [Bacillus cereus]
MQETKELTVAKEKKRPC